MTKNDNNDKPRPDQYSDEKGSGDPHRRFIKRYRAMSEIRRHFFDLNEDSWEDNDEAKQGLKRKGIGTVSRCYLNISLFLPVAWNPFGMPRDDRGLLVSWSIVALTLAILAFPLGIPGRYVVLALLLTNAFVAWIYLKFKEAKSRPS